MLTLVPVFLFYLLYQVFLAINASARFTLLPLNLVLAFVDFLALLFLDYFELFREVTLHLQFVVFQIFDELFETLDFGCPAL